MAQFRRWRTDKKPSDCTYAQLEVVPPQELEEIFPTRPLSLRRLVSTLFFFLCLFLTPFPPFTGGIVIGVGSFLRRPQCFGHMA